MDPPAPPLLLPSHPFSPGTEEVLISTEVCAYLVVHKASTKEWLLMSLYFRMVQKAVVPDTDRFDPGMRAGKLFDYNDYPIYSVRVR